MALSKSYSSHPRINYQRPCTSSEGRLCHVFRDISAWNKFFWTCGLELREPSVGELSLVVVYEAYEDWNVRKMTRAAATLVCCLLTRHRCFTSVEIPVWTFWRHQPRICDALSKSPSLRKLSLILQWSEMHPAQNFAASMGYLEHLRELECGGEDFDRSFTEGLSQFLASTRSLTTLTLNELITEREEDDHLYTSGTRAERVNHDAVVQHVSTQPLQQMGGQHALSHGSTPSWPPTTLRDNQKLCSLSVCRCGLRHFNVLGPMIEALLSNHYLNKLSIDGL
ncbi:hypothetical protein MTO96_037090 [Rhipicephalus appendiculatus]